MSTTLEDYLATEKPEVVKNAKKKAEKILLDIRLSELRQKLQITQTEMAELLGTSQPRIVQIEQSEDIKLSTLKRYVEASGGKLSLDVELPDGSHFGINI